MATPKPGDYITAKCRRCDDVTGHIIMLVLDGAIAKVECRACGSAHKYRGDGTLPAPKKANAPTRLVRSGQTRDVAKDISPLRAPALGQKKKTVVEKRSKNSWQEAMVRLNIQNPIPYSMKEHFEEDTLIMHPIFGRGVVISAIKPDKIDVLFEIGLKTLRCSLNQ